MAYYEHLPIYKKAMETAVYVERELVDVDGVEVMHVHLFITGYNFGNGYEPIVKLAGTPGEFEEGAPLFEHEGKVLWGMLVVCTVPITEMLSEMFPEDDLFTLPSNLLLTVQTGPSVHEFDTFNVMLPGMP